MYATAFEEMNALNKLEAFASFNGPDFYGMSRNTETITLERTPWQIPDSYPLAGDDKLIPMMAGETLNWKLIK